MPRDLILIRHGNEPDDDRVNSFAVLNGFRPVTYRPFLGDVLPRPHLDLGGTVIFGGMQAAEDDSGAPYLSEELRWIRNCIDAQIPVLGICLGAQLIIRSLGGRVGPLNGDLHEFGYYPITPTPAGRGLIPEDLVVTEAHYHTFTLPKGVELLATGNLYHNQAFRFGDKVYGLQFHPECTIEIFRRWQAGATSYGKPGAQTKAEQDALMALHDARQAEWFYGFLEKLFGTAT